MPGFSVSSRAPRANSLRAVGSRRCRGRRPRSRPRTARPRGSGSTVTNTLPPPYLAAFSIRLPRISSRSCRSIATSAPRRRRRVSKRDFRIEPGDRALDRLDALEHVGARMAHRAAADGAGAGEVVVDLAAHRRRLAQHGLVEIGRVRAGGVGQHGQRGLERMGEVAGMGARFLGLLLGMGEQRVQFLDHRLHFLRQRIGDAVRRRSCGSARSPAARGAAGRGRTRSAASPSGTARCRAPRSSRPGSSGSRRSARRARRALRRR